MRLYNTYSSETEALAAQAMLHAEGFESQIVKNDVGGTFPSLAAGSGYQLFVEEKSTSIPANKNVASTAVQKESLETEPAGKKWFLYGGFAFGIIAGILISILYSVYRNDTAKHDPYLKHIYSFGVNVETIADRNHDGKPDHWTHFLDNGLRTAEGDENFDGKTDYWYKQVRFDSSFADVDVDSNGISDMTAYYKFGLTNYIIYHPNNPKVIIKAAYYKTGILYCELSKTEPSGATVRKRVYDGFGNVISETLLNNSSLRLSAP
jgi:hypothetical protein